MNYEHMAKSTPIKKGTAKLEAELAKAWRDIETLSVVELAGRNANVSEYVKHWEGRATKAEQQAEADAALMRQALEALETGKNHGVAIDALRRALAEQPAQTEFKPDWMNYQQGKADGAAAEREAFPNLTAVINWLENGCDPKEAAKELRLYAAAIIARRKA